VTQISGDKRLLNVPLVLKLGLLVIPFFIGLPCGRLIWPQSGSPYQWGLYLLISLAAAVAIGCIGLAVTVAARFLAFDAQHRVWSPIIALAFLAGELTVPAIWLVEVFTSGNQIS
jgi:hypothetical protein